jgi:oxalate decarboxylase/phosphoglucose isomerase-like protein (cupin superfamily)
MDPRFNEIFTRPENQIFKVVFFPDRIYHEAALNATISPRYRYNVREVRAKHDIQILKGEVYLDSRRLCNFLRLEYIGGRLVEVAREKNRLLREQLLAWVQLQPQNTANQADATVKLTYSERIRAYQVEIWQTLEPPPGTNHDVKVLAMMGQSGSITRIKTFNPALDDLKGLKVINLAFRENDRDMPFGYKINDPAWDNDYLRSHQVPNNPAPSSPENTVEDNNYSVYFQRGWFLQANDILPVRYRNAMMDPDNPERADNNIVEMRWILQRELGGNLVYFHEVTVTPGSYEGSHRHIGSEELYYIVSGKGIAYMGRGDDPDIEDKYPTVTKQIYGTGPRPVKELPVEAGNIIYTKSGGIHGIRNTGTEPLKFVAFGYHSN